jgi:uncharacterized delta-60 repeat protein
VFSTITLCSDLENSFGLQIKPDGKIILASVVTSGVPKLYLVKLDASGNLDGSLGSGGIQKHPLEALDFFQHQLQVYPDNKMMVLSYSVQKKEIQTILTRYLGDGKLDNNFSQNGKAFLPLKVRPEEAKDINPLSDGKIFLAGCIPQKENCLPSVSMLKANLEKDPSFGKQGVLLLEALTKDHVVRSSEYKGNVYLAGSIAKNNQPHLFLLKTSIDGKTEFLKTFDEEPILANKILVDGKSNIYVVGESFQNKSSSFIILKFLSNGELDKSFGTNGKVHLNNRVADQVAKFSGRVIALRANKLIVSGDYQTDKEIGIAVYRLSDMGALDKEFGKEGCKLIPLDSFYYPNREKGFHLTAFQLGTVFLLQSGSPLSISPYVGWAPYYQYSPALSFGLNLGVYFPMTALNVIFEALDYSASLNYHFHPFFTAKIGAGAQTWIGFGGSALQINAQLHWNLLHHLKVQKKWATKIFNSVYVGYTFLADVTTTHLFRAGIGMEF